MHNLGKAAVDIIITQIPIGLSATLEMKYIFSNI